ncbi:TIGR01777 family oxidoreductase [Bradyrhizobium sp. AUGA SZCCT0222]|uniref:TIGR01777 family oxidoreductase n=1 Tax=Bradyrhizobium sp. AUGA SZCCT0222 TaxID=2807668 RepID=UPI001BA77A5B|nr:TIGR01777 family oxidoreductase [Bradyrhizobium sp. AUGA SZCCT0222]MBR1270210.1 TIGR01777 family oxidoreductase [Bradyrhizobium sp. AUGA SZCCT0222]
MTSLLWTLIAIQIVMGVFDTFYHHELTERLAWRPSQRYELQLHGVRNMMYAFLFLVLGWLEVYGIFAMAIIAVLVAEVIITLLDFVEEDMSRKLPASERINHTLLAINYGAILVLLLPVLIDWAMQPTGVKSAYTGWLSMTAAAAAVGAALCGLRDFTAARRLGRMTSAPAAGLVEKLPDHQTVLVTGATGFIGSRLVASLTASGHQVIALVRNPAKAELPLPITLITSLDQIPADAKIDTIVNLAGEPIGNGLWTEAKRRKILESRIQMTSDVVDLIGRLERKPKVLVSGSAIGWYGLWQDQVLTESAKSHACFSHELCDAWERAASPAAEHGVRVAYLRIGLVIGTDGGFITRMLTPFEFGLGGPLGSGKQWMSWIERDDLVRLIAHVIASPGISGPINATAPIPVTNLKFTEELGRRLHRPAVFRIPDALLRWVGGDFANELLLGGQRVLPNKALMNGFKFRHETLRSAFDAIL